jgi:NIMA-interacting peptidyl-prolyl cis-trans isomerase 1
MILVGHHHGGIRGLSQALGSGDLGFFGRKKMQSAFEHASFALDIGELSAIVDSTSSGVHIIQ